MTEQECNVITAEQIVAIRLEDDVVKLCKRHATKADIRGRSNIETKRTKQEEYQLVGQLCEAATHLWFTGSIDEYDKRRRKLNKNPHKGDGGYDVIDKLGRRVDCKGSMMRGRAGTQLEDYMLYVRAKERHADRYILCLCDPNTIGLVYLVGWWPDYLFNGKQQFLSGDQYRVSGHALYPMIVYWQIA